MFEITFALEQNLQGKNLKRAIDDYHFLTSGRTNYITLKAPNVNEEPDVDDVDDGSKRFEISFKIYRLFDVSPVTGKVIGYDATH